MISTDDCMRRFGPPEKESGMMLWDVPASLEIGVIPKRIYCNELMIEPLTRAFGNLIESGCVAELKTWDGCFNIRPQRGTRSTPSRHSWGLAVDVNAAWNRMGHPPTLSKAFVKCFTDSGFVWGGSWKKTDGMHFELAKLA